MLKSLIFLYKESTDLLIKCINVSDFEKRNSRYDIILFWPLSVHVPAKSLFLNAQLYIDSLVKDCSTSIAYALEMLQSSTKPSISSFSNTSSTNMFPRVSKSVLKSFKSQDLKGRPTRNIHDTSWHGHTFFIVGPLWGEPHPQRTVDVELLSCRWFEMTRCSGDINLMRQT